MPPLRLALAQINPIVGAIEDNAGRIVTSIERAEALGADLVVFPELALAGYPPEDLLLKPRFVQASGEALSRLRGATRNAAALVGFPDGDGGDVYNAAALLCGGDHVATYHKIELPNYGVFDEKRYFRAGEAPLVFELNGVRIGVCICEDIWVDEGRVAPALRRAGVQLVVNLSASPYNAGKMGERLDVLRDFARRAAAPLACCNLVGGQDEFVFDGGSVIVGADGEVVAKAPQFVEDLLVCDLEFSDGAGSQSEPERAGAPPIRLRSDPPEKPRLAPCVVTGMGRAEEIYAALVLGTRDYVRKNGFERVVIGLSGGVDSALCAAIAVDALGADNVTCVSMPSRYSSTGTMSDAERMAANLGVRFHVRPIEPIFEAFAEGLGPVFSEMNEGRGEDGCGLAFENLQARIRGTILMSIANRFDWLVLMTGNKSESAVGYCTLYGDMAGGFAVIKDVPKMLVYELARFVNQRAGCDVIPESVLTRAPSAELCEDQKDEDSLPPYATLDPIIEAYVEEDRPRDRIVASGWDEAIVGDVIRMVDRAEYKRRQAPPGVKITPNVFGRDRRMPMTNRFIEE